jgi:hypothetical protein
VGFENLTAITVSVSWYAAWYTSAQVQAVTPQKIVLITEVVEKVHFTNAPHIHFSTLEVHFL